MSSFGFTSFAGGYTENRARVWMDVGGTRTTEQLLTDAFGNAIGNSMAGVHVKAAEKERMWQAAMDVKAVSFLTASLGPINAPLDDTLWLSYEAIKKGGVNCAATSSNGEFSNKIQQMGFVMGKTPGLEKMSPEAFVTMVLPTDVAIAKAASLDYAFVMRELVLYHMAVKGDEAEFRLNDTLAQEALTTDIQEANGLLEVYPPEGIYNALFLPTQLTRYNRLNKAMGSLRTLSNNLSSGKMTMEQYAHSFNQSKLAPSNTVAPEGFYRMQNFGNISGPKGNTALGGSLHVTAKVTVGEGFITGYLSKDGPASADIYNTLPENVYFNSVGGVHKSLSGEEHNHERYYYFGEIFVEREAVGQQSNSIPWPHGRVV